MKKVVKIIALVLVVLACAGGVVWSMTAPLALEVRILEPETATLTFTEQGSYDYAERRTVFPLVAGEVLEVRVAEGDTVAVGDVIAVVSASDYQYQIEQLSRSIDGYNAQINGADLQEQQRRDNLSTSLEGLKGQLAALEAEINRSEQDKGTLQTQIEIQEMVVWFNRNVVDAARDGYRDARDWEQDDYVSSMRQAYATAQATLTQSELMLEQLRSGALPDGFYDGQVESLQSQIETLSGQIDQDYAGGTKQYYAAQIAATRSSIAQLQEKAGKAEVVASAAGVISDLPVMDANVISQQSPVATIGVGRQLEVFVPIREIDGIHVGDRVELILDKRLGKETIAGTVAEIEREAQIKLSALGVEERKVRVLVQPQRTNFAIGYDMDVQFTVYSQQNALVVPKTALFSDGDEDFVWVVADGLITRRPVTQGIETRDGYIIDDGLASGDAVVIDANNTDLREGRSAMAA